jgi:hypothetical protein
MSGGEDGAAFAFWEFMCLLGTHGAAEQEKSHGRISLAAIFKGNPAVRAGSEFAGRIGFTKF